MNDADTMFVCLAGVETDIKPKMNQNYLACSHPSRSSTPLALTPFSQKVSTGHRLGSLSTYAAVFCRVLAHVVSGVLSSQLIMSTGVQSEHSD